MAANKETSDAIWRIRGHFQDHGLLYWSAIVCLIVIAVAVPLAVWKRSSDGPRASEVMKWEKVEAMILSAEISEINTSDDVSFSTRIGANLVLRYEVEGESREVKYFTNWRRKDQNDWAAILSPGKKVPLRVSPEESNTVSLFDLIGVP